MNSLLTPWFPWWMVLSEAIHKAKGEKAKAKALEEQQTARKEKAKLQKAKKVAKNATH